MGENIIPPSLVGDLKEVQQQNLLQTLKKVKSLSQRHVGVSVLFADLVGFTAFAAQVDPFKVMGFLNDLFQVFDGMCDEYNVYKIETIGDCYVAAVGVVTGELVAPSPRDLESSELSQDLTQPRNNSSRLVLERYRHHNSKTRNASTLNARDLVAFAKAMIQGSRDVMKPIVNTPAIMRVGIHTVSSSNRFFAGIHIDSFPSSLFILFAGLLREWHHWYQESEVLFAWGCCRNSCRDGEQWHTRLHSCLGSSCRSRFR